MKAESKVSPLAVALRDYEQRTKTKFKPSREFYIEIGINRIRFWQLVHGKKELLNSESKRLADYFNISVLQLM